MTNDVTPDSKVDSADNAPVIQEEQNSEKTIKPKKVSKKTLIICAISLVIVLIAAFSFMGSRLTDTEESAVNNCQYLIDHLKNPDSFKLYDDIQVLQVYNRDTDSLENEYMFIKYGGSNSYGAMVKSTCAFDEVGYLADMDDDLEESDFSSASRYKAYNLMLANRLLYQYSDTSKDSTNSDSSFYMELVTVSQELVEKKLGLN